MGKKTLLYDEHINLGAKMADFAGWEMPIQYEGISTEHLAVRNIAGLFDVSHMGIFLFEGEEASDLLNYLTPSDIKNLPDMKAQYTLLLTEEGTIVDDIIIYKFDAHKYLMVVNAANKKKDYVWIKEHLRKKLNYSDVSAEYSLLALQGPQSGKILSELSARSRGMLDEIPSFGMRFIEIQGLENILAARTGYTGEDGFEIFAPAEKSVLIWNYILKAGEKYGLKPVGLAARNTLRLEKKFSLYGNEIDETTNPFEAGLGWVVKLKKDADFIGKDRLKELKKTGIKRRLVGFKMIDKGIPRHGYKIKKDGTKIGVVTSGTFSPCLKHSVGIGYVPTELAETGNKISVDIRGREKLAEIVKTPFVSQQ